MQDAANFPGAFLSHKPQSIGGRFAIMDDKRLAQLFGRANVRAKAFALPFRLVLLPVIVEAGFANGHHLGMLRQTNEFIEAWLACIGRFGMQADAGKDMRMRLGQCQHSWKIFQRHPNA